MANDWAKRMDELIGHPEMDLIIETTLDLKLHKQAELSLQKRIDEMTVEFESKAEEWNNEREKLAAGTEEVQASEFVQPGDIEGPVNAV